jgi:Na+/H+ antiporter NhaA
VIIALAYSGHLNLAALAVGLAILGDRLQQLFHPWTSYLIVPLFALANAGSPSAAASSPAPTPHQSRSGSCSATWWENPSGPSVPPGC